MSPNTMPADPLVDAVFDARTGYHVITKPAGRFENHPQGEGDGAVFSIVRCKRSELPETWRWQVEEDPEDRSPVWTKEPVFKLDLAAHKAARRADATSKLGNVYAVDALRAAPASLEDYFAETRRFDAFEMAIITVGAAGDYATISGAITAASSGDTITELDGATYDEAVTFSTKVLALIGSDGAKIRNSTGIPLTLNNPGNRGSLVRNWTLEVTSTGNYCCYSSVATVLDRLKGIGSDTYCFYIRSGTIIRNSWAHNGTVGFYLYGTTEIVSHCAAAGMSGAGFHGRNADYGVLDLCLSGDNTGADYSNIAAVGYGNVSEDGTAPGPGAVTGFDPDDWTDKTTGDLTIRAGVKDSTAAKLVGYPVATLDVDDGTRKTAGVVYAGPSDPDPDTGAAPVAPVITAVSVSGAMVTATVDGDDGVTNWVRLIRRSTGAVADEESRSGDGDVSLTAPATSAAYDLVAYSQSGGFYSKPGAPWPVYVSAGAVQTEICEALVARLAAASGVTDRIASADAIYRRRPARAAGHPCITYEFAPVPDPEAPSDKIRGELAIELWGFERDVLDELLEAVTDALVGERLDTTNWTVKRLARVSVEPAGSETADEATGRTLERLATVWRFAAYRKGQ